MYARVTDSMNGLHKCRKATFFQPLIFLPCMLKLPQNKLLLVLNSLICFCFDGGEYGTRWVKNVKDNVIRLNKQQIKDSIAYLLSNCYFTPFLSSYFYVFMKVSG